MNLQRSMVMANAVCLALLAACSSNVGIQVDDFKPAQTPAGVSTELLFYKGVVKGNKISGELIAVMDSGLLLLLHKAIDTTDGKHRFVEVPFSIMRRAKFEQVGSAGIQSESKAMDEARLARLRLLSRFPQGLSDDLKAELLATYVESGVHLLETTAEKRAFGQVE